MSLVNVTHPSQYPEWLETNKPRLSPEDYQRYEQQAKLMGEICGLFEREEQDSGDKESTFESIMDLMQKVDTLDFSVAELLIVNEIKTKKSESVSFSFCLLSRARWIIWLVNVASTITVTGAAGMQI